MASEEDIKAYELIVRNTLLKIITDKLKEGEKTLSDLEAALNEVSKDLDPLVVRLYMDQLEAEGFVEKKGSENPSYALTEKWKKVEAEKGSQAQTSG